MNDEVSKNTPALLECTIKELEAMGLAPKSPSSWRQVFNQVQRDYVLPKDFPENYAEVLVLHALRDLKDPGTAGRTEAMYAASGKRMTAHNSPIKGSCLQNDSESIEGKEKAELCKRIEQLDRQIVQLKNERIDRDYESGYFIEEDVFRKIEEENCRLKMQCEQIYQKLVRVWFKMIEDRVKSQDE